MFSIYFSCRWALGLGVVLLALGCARQENGVGVAAEDCGAPQWEAHDEMYYTFGEEVQHGGQLYSCKQTGWCDLAAYEPGGVNSDYAWNHLGVCTAPELEDNRVSVVFPAAPEVSAGSAAAAPVSRAGELTGYLQCGAELHEISGSWGETVLLTGLKKCDYMLVLDATAVGNPLNAPKLVSFSEEKGQSIEFLAKYRRPVDPSQLLTLPGVSVEVFAAGLNQPRQMALNGDGTVLYVGSSSIPNWSYGGVQGLASHIYAVELDRESGKPLRTHVLATGLEGPHGVVWRNGDLYYSTTGKLMVIRGVDAVYKQGLVAAEEVLKFPADDSAFPLNNAELGGSLRRHHEKHPLYFNPNDANDNNLYAAVGRPCNVCRIPTEPRYGSLLRYNLDTGKSTLIAEGVRNSVGFDWNPVDGKIWFSDNNRQNIENRDELNVIDNVNRVKDYGAPHMFGDVVGISESEWERRDDLSGLGIPRGAQLSDQAPGEVFPAKYVAPAFMFQNSSAPLGVKFWRNGSPAKDGEQALLVAIHGSGVPERPGMNVMMMTIRAGKVVAGVPLITGWYHATDSYCLGTEPCGRPVDFLEMKDGSMLLSDDVTGVIYRIRYSAEGLPGTALTVTAPAAPDPALAAKSITGRLTDALGRTRDFDLGWGSSLSIPGLAFGRYTVRLNNMDDWVPESFETDLDLNAEQPTASVQAGYKPRPDNVEVPLTLRAPAKPEGAGAAQWVVTLKRDGEEQTHSVQVEWGGTADYILGYGTYDVRFPYTEKARPSPQRETVVITEHSSPLEKTTTYAAAAELGQYMLETGDCAGCHATAFWKDPAKAAKWEGAGIEPLKNMIKGMKVPGHCDDVCAGEIGQYLFGTVWKEYLGAEGEYGPRQLRLLSRDEYVQTLKDVLGLDVAPALLPSNQAGADFLYASEARFGRLYAEQVRKYYDIGVALEPSLDVAALAQRYGATAPEFVAKFGRMMFRRPLSADEQARYEAAYTLAENGGVANVVLSMLASPHFLFRSEMGRVKSGEDGVYELTPYERATALSYTILGTTPEDALLNQAGAGGLDTPEKMAAVAKSMSEDPRAAEQFAKFLEYYVGTPRDKIISSRPGLDAELIEAMRAEQRESAKEAYANGTGELYELFNPAYSYLNGPLATHYGIGGVTGPAMIKKDLDADQQHWRGGLLNAGLFAVTYANDTTTSIILRGFNVRRQLFCQKFISNALRPEPDSYPDVPMTSRMKWDHFTGEAASNGTCWTCHKFFNDTGAALENYDAAGRYRQAEKAVNAPYTDQEVDIVSKGPLISDIGGTWIEEMQDARDIAKNVPVNNTALRCLAEGYYRQATGAQSDAYSNKTVLRLRDQLANNQGKLREMIVAMMISGSMLDRTNRESTHADK